ncbi:MAG TPA: hypothetical protein PLC39_00915 [Methanomassiliicoccales archaeon]|nr:hypothetical protein [Methanomassiliicoccales archaeon]HNX47070.1 hypothetical protein [Methanomassiliicoccales archaeon]HPR97846.1 hypothetical protein [Methanomassiliicoccales archaeon]
MGRTVPTYRMASETLFQSWSDFRRALSQEDRAAFDRLSDKVRLHASACSIAAFLDPLEGALLSILLEQEKELERLRKKA